MARLLVWNKCTTLRVVFFYMSFALLTKCITASDSVASQQTETSSPLTEGCPLEYYHNIKSVGSSPFAVGQEMTLQCDDQNNPREHFVYPKPNRFCLSNGTWSGKPPACVQKPSIEVPNASGYLNVRDCYFCEKGKCAESLGSWQPIGRIHSSCSENVETSSDVEFEQFQVYFEFARHVHLSYMTFVIADTNGSISRPYNVQFLVRSEDVIDDLSVESAAYLENHYENSADTKAKNECAVIGISVYTRGVLARFFAEKDTDPDLLQVRWRPKPRFYSVLEPNSESMRARYGDGCPKAPSIINGFIKEVSNDAVVFACNPGFILIDPTTQAVLEEGKIQCYRDFEWTPYPFPICVKKGEEAYEGDQEPDGFEFEILPAYIDSGIKFPGKSFFHIETGATLNETHVIVITGLVILAIAAISVVVIVCIKYGSLFRSDNQRRKFSLRNRLYGLRRADKKNNRSSSYTNISETISITTCQSGHVYETVDETIDKTIIRDN